jgi:CBS domain containing-hemolysin-like protein
MVGFILALVLLGIALLALALQKTYSVLTEKELRRRARAKDPIATVLYRAVAYGATLRTVLWVIVVITASGSFVLLSRIAPPPLAFITVVIAIGYGFVWMPAHKATAFGMRIAVWLTPAVAWLLDKVHPLFDKAVAFAQKHRPVTVHTGLYDREDLLALIERQRHQPDSRISPDTLDLLMHSLTFGDKLVRECMVPRRAVQAIPATTPVSPAMINELHASGFSRVPVYEGDNSDEPKFVGTLYLRDLITLKHSGTVADSMHKKVYYVHEDHPLEQVLDAFLKTHHHLFIVVNSFEEFVGIITIEDILEQILGCKIVDEFDQYDDLRAVASHRAKVDHHERKKKGTEVVEHSDPDIDKENPYPEGTLKHVIYEAGFRDGALEVAFGVAMAESSGDPKAHNDDASTGDDSYGLFQINMLGDMGPERRKLYGLKKDDELFDPLTNAQVAFQISEGGTNWKPWTMYTNGGYQKFYDKKANHKLS